MEADPEPEPEILTFAFNEEPFTSDSSQALGRASISGDAAFFDEVNRVLGNLRAIRAAQPFIGTLVSFASNADGQKFKIELV